jgi:hypothetical protein
VLVAGSHVWEYLDLDGPGPYEPRVQSDPASGRSDALYPIAVIGMCLALQHRDVYSIGRHRDRLYASLHRGIESLCIPASQHRDVWHYSIGMSL